MYFQYNNFIKYKLLLNNKKIIIEELFCIHVFMRLVCGLSNQVASESYSSSNSWSTAD